MRVPAFIWAASFHPNRRARTSYDGLFHVSDWFPTLARAAGIAEAKGGNPSIDGIDQWGAINGNETAETREDLILHFNMWSAGIEHAGKESFDDAKAAIRSGPWKYIQNEVGDRAYKPSENCSAIFCGLRRSRRSATSSTSSTTRARRTTSSTATRTSPRASSNKLKVFYRFADATWHAAWAPPEQQNAYPIWEEANSDFVVPWNGNSTWRENFERKAQNVEAWVTAPGPPARGAPSRR